MNEKLRYSGLSWCLHCERVKASLVQDHEGQLVEFCGYGDCDGGPLDLAGWLTDGVRGGPDWGMGKPDLTDWNYPAVPVEGVVYPLYPDRPETKG